MASGDWLCAISAILYMINIIKYIWANLYIMHDQYHVLYDIMCGSLWSDNYLDMTFNKSCGMSCMPYNMFHMSLCDMICFIYHECHVICFIWRVCLMICSVCHVYDVICFICPVYSKMCVMHHLYHIVCFICHLCHLICFKCHRSDMVI